MVEKTKVKVAVFLVLEHEGQYLFSQRHNTGFRDGFYTLPSGHVDVDETPLQALVREAQEEISLTISIQNIEFVHAMFERDTYADYYFKVTHWSGEPLNSEPHKCKEIRWASLNDVENQVVEKVKTALLFIQRGVMFSEIDRMV